MQVAEGTSCAPAVLEERAGNVLTLRLNRPNRLNALNAQLCRELADALRHAATNESIRVVVLTGAGRAFSAGGDLAELRVARERNALHELNELLLAGKEIVLAIAAMPKPVVAAVNGPAAGAGMNLALACDVRIASEQAIFAQSFAHIGLYPDFGGTYFLRRLVGAARAAELFFTGETLTAAQAEELGIVSHVASAEKFEEESHRLAERLAKAPPLPVRAVKRALRGKELEELERVLDEESRNQAECFASEDAMEGFQAFFAKRKPVFQGR